MRTLERIARKICERLGDDPDCMAYPPMAHVYAFGRPNILLAPAEDYCQPKPLWNWYLPMAEAAIRALESIEEGTTVGGVQLTTRHNWRYFLREILNEKEG